MADPSKSAIATVTVTSAPAPAPTVGVEISSNGSSVVPNGTLQLSASVSGSTNTAVTWSTTGGSISSSGLFTAPSTSDTYTVTATSVADPSKSASVNISVVSVTLSWTPSDSKVSNYRVYRSQQSGGSYVPVAMVGGSQLSFIDTSLAAGRSYFYVVTGVDASGAESPFSAEVSAQMP